MSIGAIRRHLLKAVEAAGYTPVLDKLCTNTMPRYKKAENRLKKLLGITWLRARYARHVGCKPTAR